MIDVMVPGCREKLAEWLCTRGGVAVWHNLDLGNSGAGLQFTPAKSETGEPTKSPHWAYGLQAVVTDINEFRFVARMQEVSRFHVAVKRGDGLRFDLTPASARKLRKRLSEVEADKTRNPHGYEPCYEFDYDTQDAVIVIPVFEGEA